MGQWTRSGTKIGNGGPRLYRLPSDGKVLEMEASDFEVNLVPSQLTPARQECGGLAIRKPVSFSFLHDMGRCHLLGLTTARPVAQLRPTASDILSSFKSPHYPQPAS